MSVAEELKILVKAEVDKAKRDLASWRGEVNNTVRNMQNFAKSMIGVGSVTAGVVMLSRAFKENVVEGIRFTAQIEKQTVAFETLLKSLPKAEILMQDIQRFSAETPFQLEQLTRAAQVLVATGTEAAEVTQVLEDLGNAAMGDASKLDRLADAYAKLQTKGKASLEEINRFTEAGVPILDALATRYDLTREKLFEYISAGKVGFEEVNQALQDLTRGEGAFAGMLEKQSQTLDGSMSTLKDNVALLRMAFVQDLVPAITDAVQGMTEWVIKIREAKEEASLGRDLRSNMERIRDTDYYSSLSREEQKKLVQDAIAGLPAARDTAQSNMFLQSGLTGGWGASRAMQEYQVQLTQLEQDRSYLNNIMRGIDLQERYAGQNSAIQQAMREISELVAELPSILDGSARAQAIEIRQALIDATGMNINQIAATYKDTFQSLFNQAWNWSPQQAQLGEFPVASLYGMGINPNEIETRWNLTGPGRSVDWESMLYDAPTPPRVMEYPELDPAAGITGDSRALEWALDRGSDFTFKPPTLEPSDIEDATDALNYYGVEAYEVAQRLSELNFVTEEQYYWLQDYQNQLEGIPEVADAAAEAIKELGKSLDESLQTTGLQAFKDMATALGTSMVDAASGAKDFLSAVTNAVSSVIRAIGDYLLQMATVYALAQQWGKAAAALGAAGAAYVLAGTVNAAGAQQVSQMQAQNQGASASSVSVRPVTVNVFGDITDGDRTTAKIVSAVRSMGAPV